MASPFPGMDPYLEEPELWFEFPSRLINAIRDVLVARVPPEYTVRFERGVVLTEGESGAILARFRPDLAILPGGVPSGISESTPLGARGAIAVEVPVFDAVEQARLVIRRRGREREVVTVIELLSPVNKAAPGRDVKDPLPAIAIPLRREDGEVMLPLKEALDLAYERGR